MYTYLPTIHVRQSLNVCDELILTGQFEKAIQICKSLLQQAKINSQLNQELQIILKLQSYLYNSGKYIQAKNLIMITIDQKQLSMDKYYHCRFNLAMGAVTFKTTYGSLRMMIQKALSYYTKSKQLYYQLLSYKDPRVINNLQLKVKIFINILLLLHQNIDQIPPDNLQSDVVKSKLMILDKATMYADSTHTHNDSMRLSDSIGQIIQNLLQIKSDIYTLNDKQITDYYKIFHMSLIGTIITACVNSNMTQIKYNGKFHDISDTIRWIFDIVYSIEGQSLSYRNKYDFIRASQGVFNILTTILSTYMTVYNILSQHGLQYRLLHHLKNLKEKTFGQMKMYNCNQYAILYNDIQRFDTKLLKYNISQMEDQQVQQKIYCFVYYLQHYSYIIRIANYIIQKTSRTMLQLQQNKQRYNLNKLIFDMFFNLETIFDKNKNKYLQSLQQYRIYFLQLAKTKTEFNHDNIYNYNLIQKVIQLQIHYTKHEQQYERLILLTALNQNCQQIQQKISIVDTYSSMVQIGNILNDKMKLINQLQSSNNILQTFAHVLAHDMITPIRTISNFVYQIINDQKNVLSQDSKKSLQLIRQSTKKATMLISSTYQYAQIGKVIEKQQFDCVQLINEVLHQYQQQIESKRINVNLIEQSFTHKIYADKILMYSVLSNLISNAIKACNKQYSIIQIGMQLQNWIYVMDNGRGMEQFEIQKIFDLFYRSDSMQGINGTGVGMAIVKRILQKHQSLITINSQKDIGTTISFTIPLVK